MQPLFSHHQSSETGSSAPVASALRQAAGLNPSFENGRDNEATAKRDKSLAGKAPLSSAKTLYGYRQSIPVKEEVRQVLPFLHVLPFPLEVLSEGVVRAIFRQNRVPVHYPRQVQSRCPSAFGCRFPRIPPHTPQRPPLACLRDALRHFS